MLHEPGQEVCFPSPAPTTPLTCPSVRKRDTRSGTHTKSSASPSPHRSQAPACTGPEPPGSPCPTCGRWFCPAGPPWGPSSSQQCLEFSGGVLPLTCVSGSFRNRSRASATSVTNCSDTWHKSCEGATVFSGDLSWWDGRLELAHAQRKPAWEDSGEQP